MKKMKRRYTENAREKGERIVTRKFNHEERGREGKKSEHHRW